MLDYNNENEVNEYVITNLREVLVKHDVESFDDCIDEVVCNIIDEETLNTTIISNIVNSNKFDVISKLYDDIYNFDLRENVNELIKQINK